MVRYLDDNATVRELSVGLLVAVLVGLMLLAFAVRIQNNADERAQKFEDQRTDRAEVLENTRFVRTLAQDYEAIKLPFGSLNLRGAVLDGLSLDCHDSYGHCADLAGADLSGASLISANLAGADLSSSDLSGANLSGANLWGTKLDGANMAGTKLDLACYRSTDSRQWPKPPIDPPICDDWPDQPELPLLTTTAAPS